MGFYLAVFFLVTAAALQTSVLPELRLLIEAALMENLNFGLPAVFAQPGLVLLLVISWVAHADWDEALFWVFLGGILQDLLSIVPVGTTSLVLLLLLFIMKTIQQRLTDLNIVIVAGIVVFGTLLHSVAIYTMLIVTYQPPNLVLYILAFIVPTVVLNLFIFPFVYVMLRVIQSIIPDRQSTL